MSSLNSKKGFKALAIACAVLLTCASAQMFANTNIINNSSYVYAEAAYTDEGINADGCYVIKLNDTTITSASLSLSGGKTGYTTSGQVGYWDNEASEWVIYDEWEDKKFDSTGKLTISNLKVPAGINEVQILITYYAVWDNDIKDMVLGNMSDITVTNVTTNGTGGSGSNSGDSGNSGGNTGGNSGGNTTNPMPSDAECGWVEVDNATATNSNTKNVVSTSSSGDTKTVTLVQGGQWSSYDEGNEPIILDQTWKPEVEGQYDTDTDNEKITNSNNFMFADDFGVPSKAEIDHFRFTFESDQPMYQVQVGAGISVQKDSDIANSGSTDIVNGTIQKIWFNESGTYDPENEKDYATLENSNGKKYYGYNRGKTAGETNYLQLQWNVYDDVKPFIQNDNWSSVSVQYWYGVDPADWDTIDWENPPADLDNAIEKKPAQINVTEASCIYNLTETYDYTDTASSTDSQTAKVGGEMVGVKLSDLGLTEKDTPKAVTVKLKANQDIGKLLCGFGVSVSDDYTGEDVTDNFYQTANLVYEECSDTYELTWIIPSTISDFVEPEYDAEVKFGVWDARVGETALDTIEVQEISVDYYTQSEVTTATVTEPPASVTEPDDIEGGIKGDLVDLGMGPIDPADDDETSPTFHQFSIEPITQLLPTDYNPTTDDIAQIVFNISSPVEMKDITSACGVAVSLDCKDATDEYWYQGKDFKVSDTGKNVTITWTVPESIREYIQENQYGKVNLGIWYAGEGVDEVYLDSAYIVYTSKAEDTTTTTDVTTVTTTATTTTAITTTTATTTTDKDNQQTDDITTPAQSGDNTSETDVNTTTTPDSSTDTDAKWGDVDCNGEVNAVDVLMLKKYLLTMITADDVGTQGMTNADVTHDDEVTSPDLVKLKKFVLTMITEDTLAVAGV